tara:strand:- start:17777 stop:19564 length:1788 start_codon:yes stop_codon:yes gene_type:complete
MDLTPSKKKAFFWIFTLFFPLFLITIVEVGLRIGGFNKQAQNLFVEVQNDNRFLVTNSTFIERYFPSFTPKIAPNPFRKKKQKNTFRVFVFGGSSTQGFPYNFYYSFSSRLEQKLLLNTDGLNVEVINLGMTAVNSYVIRDLSKRVLDYEPDAVIIYAGHNEYYGSFGVGTTQFGLVNSLFIKRLVLDLKNFRLYQLLEGILKGEAKNTSSNRTMMAEVIKESNIEKDSKLYKDGINQFEHNIDDVVEVFRAAEIPIFIGTIASNLKDQAPLGDNNEALSKYKEAKKLFEEGELEISFDRFLDAKELDAIRFRAPEAINDFISNLSKKEGVEVVKVQKMLRDSSAAGIEDETLFIDHLHPNYKGHILIADLFLDYLRKLKPVKDSYHPNSFDIPNQISEFEETYSTTTISRLLVGYPFQKGLSIEEELSRFDIIYREYLSGTYTNSIAAKTAREVNSVPLALSEVVNSAKSRNDSLTAISHYYELLKWQLKSIDIIEKSIEYSVNNRSTDTYLVNLLTQVLNDGNYDPRYIDVLSGVYLQNNELEKASYWLKESEKIDPESANLIYNYARYFILKGDTLEASKYYNRLMNRQKKN